jgi:hypothetical protein
MKQVKAAQIPIPPSGYWTKITFGKPAQKTPLNEPTHTILSLYKTGKTIIPHEVTVSPATHKTNKVAKKIVKKEPAPQLDEAEKSETEAVPEEPWLKHMSNTYKPIIYTIEKSYIKKYGQNL